MTDDERNELLALKTVISDYLKAVEKQIIDFDPPGDNAEFSFLIKKARSYHKTLAEIDRQLAEDNYE